MSYITKVRVTKIANFLLVILIGLMIFGNVVYADSSTFGQNSYNWLKGQVFYIALLVVAVIAVPFIMKKMWMQLVGFLFLAGVVLVIIDDPGKIKTIGQMIWEKIFGG